MKVLLTKAYGIGWATANDSNPDLAYDMLTWQPIINYLEQGKTLDKDHPLVQDMVTELKKKYDVKYICVIDACNLNVVDYPVYKIVDAINRHDGYERI